ncbi:hypothetical protein F3Y22_tig00112738pilonHSYRG01158 [Hibiscus syriacus]|uniref:Uncharacterized protein n=1 Tax=Hibiscus syriacus TaxID=106335 RepID=A0A6A2X7A5_HIBSY|nr:hypothetical protein F3Y22_tig00112738pilonHSYRG01158 [Hibiscus syriacus]
MLSDRDFWDGSVSISVGCWLSISTLCVWLPRATYAMPVLYDLRQLGLLCWAPIGSAWSGCPVGLGYSDLNPLKSEWVIYATSGISSGLYHACDVGTWCALSFGVLQFFDFWHSFLAVVSTFVYLTTIGEVYKRTIHTVVTILTALMAITKTTRSSNVILVMAIGALALLVGWLIEFCSKYRTLSFSMDLCYTLERWRIRECMNNLVKTLMKQFRWGFLLAGFRALAMAAISRNLEKSQNYRIWHSVWHVTIYTSSFFFLCSKVDTINSGSERPADGNYQLTRQVSLSRGY